LPFCSWCGSQVSESAEIVYRKAQGRYPLLCESCMLWEMDRRSSERFACVRCGGEIDFLRRFAIRRMEEEGISPQQLCLDCLRRQLDVVVADPHRSPKEAMTQVLLLDDWLKEKWPSPFRQDFNVLCPWCLAFLSFEKISRLRKGELVSCDDCGTTLTSDII